MDRKKAINLIIEYEKKQGRNPEVVNKFKLGYDIKSDNRFIDVKINGKKEKNLLLSFIKLKKLGKNFLNYYVYIITKEEKPKLRILEPEFILKNISLLTLISIKSNVLNTLQTIELDNQNG
ncbi:MAG: DUF3883 domain-containing protein [Candidatus Pacearchaeota archaeon]